MDTYDEAHLVELRSGPIRWFHDWDPQTDSLSTTGTGAYTIWDRQDHLVYVGVAGRPSLGSPEGRGLTGRLRAHSSGRRSGDQFCVYVADRLVLPTLSQTQLTKIAEGAASFDRLVRDYIRENLGFRMCVTGDFSAALAAENAIRAGALAVGPPALNPKSQKP